VVLYLKSLDFPTSAGNVILKLLEQAANKTFTISGDGSTTTTLSCQLLLTSLRFLVNGYNAIFISNGLKRLSYFLVDKVLEFSRPISQLPELGF
jgi:chaperonin GroEL (HSP60 family)